MSGHFGDLSEYQEEVLVSMLDMFPPPEGLTEEQLDDYKCDLLRFLRAR
jgi:hypothetical protein